MSKSGAIGTMTANGLVRLLRLNGWPYAERRDEEGALDRGDIAGTPGVCWQVKGGETARLLQHADINRWLADTDTQRRNARDDVGVLVMARRGYGPLRSQHWWAAIPADLLADLTAGVVVVTGYPESKGYVLLEVAHLLPRLRMAGYGTELEVRH